MRFLGLLNYLGFGFSKGQVVGVTEMPIIGVFLNNSTIPAGGSRFAVPGFDSLLAAENFFVVPRAISVKQLYVLTSDAQPGDDLASITLRKNGASTALSAVIAEGSAAGVFNDTDVGVSFAAGDKLSFGGLNASVSASAQIASISIGYD